MAVMCHLESWCFPSYSVPVGSSNRFKSTMAAFTIKLNKLRLEVLLSVLLRTWKIFLDIPGNIWNFIQQGTTPLYVSKPNWNVWM